MSKPHRPTTAQEIYNTVAMHLMVQGRRAVDVEGHCMYRAPNGDVCAVGVLISDSQYSRKMEKNAVARLARVGMLPDYLKPHVELLQRLQMLHDQGAADNGVFCRDTLKRSLKRVAESFELECDILAVM